MCDNFRGKDINKSQALILSGTVDGETIAAASGRISTTVGSALNILKKSDGNEKNKGLIKKVLSSGHKSIIEHCAFNMVFNNVSVLVEQFIIEFRLASFTVQSRRYVDFRNVGYFVPENLEGKVREKFVEHMDYLFGVYQKLEDGGIPKEDARFVLPYCFKSNFYCTCNARELAHMICTMIYGRGKENQEIYELGMMLKEQYDEYFPDIIDKEKLHYKNGVEERYTTKNLNTNIEKATIVKPSVELLSYTGEPEKILLAATSYNYSTDMTQEMTIKDIIKSERPRELELINYAFKINNITLSAITHLVRHRMQTVLVPNLINAVLGNKHIVPMQIEKNEELKAIYMEAFEKNAVALKELLELGMPKEDIIYFSMSGHTLDVMINMNGRELLHYFSLRTCNRAQWEIREISIQMLKQLREVSPKVFNEFGPSCYVLNWCPEGKMTCGKIVEVKNNFKDMNSMTE